METFFLHIVSYVCCVEENGIKQRIIQGAFELFMKFGIKSVTMDDLSKRLSISKKTIYQHFEDKNSLVVHIAQVHMKNEELEMEQISKLSVDAVDEMVRISNFIASHVANMNPYILFDLKKYHPAAYALFENHKECCIQQAVKNNILKGIQEGVYFDDINVDILAKLRMIEIEGAFNPDFYPPSEFEPFEVHMTIFRHFLRGILNEKGQKLFENHNKDEKAN